MLQKQFESFFSEIRIDTETATLKEKREILQDDIEDNLPDVFDDHDIELNKSDIRMIDQGSYKYNTTIKSDVVDRDVAVMIPLDTKENADPREIKKYLKEAITISSRTVEIKEPCVCASYHKDGQEYLHIDLPLYAKDNGITYLARGKSTSDKYSWEEADPDGLNDYLCNAINGNTQLRRVICYLKKWKNEKYANASSDHQIPPSIGLTLLALEIMKLASIFVHPSYREGLSVALMQAMAAGLPVVVSKIRGNVDLIKDGINGFLCAPDDVNAFALSLDRLLMMKHHEKDS
jgi:hypothetical protein